MTNPRLDAAYAAQVKTTRARVEQFVQGRFAAGQYRDEDLVRFLNQVVPVVKAGQRQVSALTDAYLSRVLTEALGAPIAPRGPIDTSMLRGVPDDTVYTRPFVTVRTELAAGKPYAQAVKAGAARAMDIVATDMQLAKTHTARSILGQTSGVVGYERVLTGAQSCALCYVASTQRYHVEDLLPIHPGCDCGVAPIVDTGQQIIYPDRLAATHQAVEDRLGSQDPGARAPDYRKQIVVHEHGEIGPVLAVRGQHFAGRTVMDT
jgi:hypothetical protein